MTKRYFYDCPIKAAYMARYHGMKIHGPARMPTGESEPAQSLCRSGYRPAPLSTRERRRAGGCPVLYRGGIG